MKILHTEKKETFTAGTTGFTDAERQIVKLEDASIAFCRQGNAHIEIDLHTYEITPNTQIVLLPGSILNIIHFSPDFRISFVTCSNELFREVTARLEPSFFRFLKEDPCYVLPKEHTKVINGLVLSMEDLYNDRDNRFRLQMARNYIQNFLLDMYDKTYRLFMQKRPEGVTRQEELFKRFILLVQKHCTTQRDVTFYATELFITARYLSTVIQNVSGTTAKNIIDKHVILEIKALLKSTDLSIQEIAHKLCFPDQSFFGRYFKKHTGISPLKFRHEP